MNIRTRIAPSPTGYIHIGTLHTALFNYFFTKQSGGTFVIRIEDTDRERLVEGATENLLKVLADLGIEHDEGPFLDEEGILEEKGDFGPYVQSQRLDLYKKYIDQLVEQGDAYYCFCSKERLDQMRESQRATKQTPKYDRTCCNLSAETVQAKLANGETHVVRLKIPAGETIFQDEIRGAIKVQNKEVDDQVILKSDGFPTYHLAVVVDDHLMEISHIIRGEEWLPSTPKHVILYKMFGWEVPVFAHVPLLLNVDKTKLSKRQGDVAVEDYLKRGYLKETLINFVGTLGFNPKSDQELYSFQELVELFDLKKVNKSGAVLNLEKLNWMNNHYLRQLSEDELKEVARPFVQADVEDEVVVRVMMIERERINRFDELQTKIDQYILEPAYDPSVLVWKNSDQADSKLQLENIHSFLDGVGEDSFEKVTKLENVIKTYIEQNGLKNGNVLWPLRVALSGQEKSASPFELLWALGKQKSLLRIKKAVDLLV